MRHQSDRAASRIILTGGPGGGKSSILDSLRGRGHVCVDEVARDLIQKEVAIDGDALLWKDAKQFRDKMFREQINVCRAVKPDGIIFFDRGPLDCLAYSRLIGAEISEEMDRVARSMLFNKTVFVTPPWREIYHNDAERKQSFEEAIETYDTIVAVYQEYGYFPLDLPKVTVKERVDFILDRV